MGMPLPLQCPICGEARYLSGKDWEVVSDTTEDNKYSFVKGAVGTALFGPVGAVAGIGGKKGKRTVKYRCPDCGYTMTRTES